MNPENLIPLSGCLLLSTLMVSCGNKGDLYLIPDPIHQEDMQQLEEVLDTREIPSADPVDVDDQSVYEKPDKDSTDTTGRLSVDK